MPSDPQSNETTFPERLRIERERLGLTQAEFGRLGGVSKTAQWQYEQGKHWPTMDYIESLRTNGVDVVYLVTGNRAPADRLDWVILRDAYLFVQRGFANRQNRQYTDEQLFEAFRSVVEAAMGLTRSDLQGTPEGETDEVTEESERGRRG